MTRMSWTARVAMALVGALAFAAIATSEEKAAELKVLTSVALTSALKELAPEFERATGNKLTIDYGLIVDMRKRVLEGESADVIILSRPAMDELQKQDRTTIIPPSTVTTVRILVSAPSTTDPVLSTPAGVRDDA